MLLDTVFINGEGLGAGLMVLGLFGIPMLVGILKMGPNKFFNVDED